ncbi:MAG: helix-turn-helix transcriptional regulator [Phycisphaeraceae bacterium]|nr:helix-turn-helix transcriptional regulator [Phycisphaeraceae bacterium]MCB9847061.1 helix-turn-helix transcriptional regulator [Phycisphaeraceae bacterium]
MGHPARQLDSAGELTLIDDPARAAVALNPIRRRLLGALDEPDSASGLARRLRLPRQKVNYHLRELERAGMVEATGETRQRRGCQERIVRAVSTAYLIDPSALGLGSAPDPDSMKDRFSSGYLIALAARAIRDVALLRRRAGIVGKNLPTFSMHADLKFGSQRALHAFTEDLASSVARCIARHHEADNTSGESREFRFFVGSYPAVTKSQEEADAEARAHRRRQQQDSEEPS